MRKKTGARTPTVARAEDPPLEAPRFGQERRPTSQQNSQGERKWREKIAHPGCFGSHATEQLLRRQQIPSDERRSEKERCAQR